MCNIYILVAYDSGIGKLHLTFNWIWRGIWISPKSVFLEQPGLVFADLFAVPLVNDSFQGQHLSDIALLLGLDRFHLWILLRKRTETINNDSFRLGMLLPLLLGGGRGPVRFHQGQSFSIAFSPHRFTNWRRSFRGNDSFTPKNSMCHHVSVLLTNDPTKIAGILSWWTWGHWVLFRFLHSTAELRSWKRIPLPQNATFVGPFFKSRIAEQFPMGHHWTL